MEHAAPFKIPECIKQISPLKLALSALHLIVPNFWVNWAVTTLEVGIICTTSCCAKFLHVLSRYHPWSYHYLLYILSFKLPERIEQLSPLKLILFSLHLHLIMITKGYGSGPKSISNPGQLTQADLLPANHIFCKQITLCKQISFFINPCWVISPSSLLLSGLGRSLYPGNWIGATMYVRYRDSYFIFEENTHSQNKKKSPHVKKTPKIIIF